MLTNVYQQKTQSVYQFSASDGGVASNVQSVVVHRCRAGAINGYNVPNPMP